MNNDAAEEAVETASSATHCTLSLPSTHIVALIDDLHQLLLILISCTYYFDCLAILYLLRFLAQNQIKSGGIRVVLTASAVSVTTHVFRAIPQPAPREYWNHGGALVDFVGEQPTTLFRLLVMDFLILALQFLYLTLWYKQMAIEHKTSQPSAPAQDLDAEEAGVSRAENATSIETEEGIEMQSLLPDETSQSATVKEHDSTVLVRRSDFKQVFLSTGNDQGTSDSGAAVRRFVERFNAVRARRAALEAQNGGRP